MNYGYIVIVLPLLFSHSSKNPVVGRVFPILKSDPVFIVRVPEIALLNYHCFVFQNTLKYCENQKRYTLQIWHCDREEVQNIAVV